MKKQILNKHGLRAVMLFIAELNGFKSGSVKDKERTGINCWLNSTLHEPDYSTEEGRAEAHENIWLERLYSSLDKHFQLEAFSDAFKQEAINDRDTLIKLLARHDKATHLWDVPIELDASASMIQYIGALLGDRRLLEMTNVIGSTLSDPWAFPGIPRTQFKHAATPLLYGSSRACHELWQSKGHKYTLEQIELFNKELQSGALGLANAFKEFLITNCKPTETMHPHIADEVFEIECNRYRNVGDHMTKYDIFDTITNSVRRITHTTTRKEADLEQFRRYFVTLLIHNLDSQVANKVIKQVMDKFGWGIDIHDAFIVHPNAAKDTRKWYANELTSIYNNRHTILTNYFKSIGIGAEAQAHWDRVMSLVHPIAGAFKANPMALK